MTTEDPLPHHHTRAPRPVPPISIGPSIPGLIALAQARVYRNTLAPLDDELRTIRRSEVRRAITRHPSVRLADAETTILRAQPERGRHRWVEHGVAVSVVAPETSRGWLGRLLHIGQRRA